MPLDVPVLFFPRTDKPPLSAKEQVRFYTYMMNGQNTKSFIHQPNFFQFIGKPGRCPAGSYRLNFCSDGKITPCNMNFHYCLGNIGIMPEAIKANIDAYLNCEKLTPIECATCEHSEVCRGGCLIAKTYMNCPMQHHVDLMRVSREIKIDLSAVGPRYENMRSILGNVVTC